MTTDVSVAAPLAAHYVQVGRGRRKEPLLGPKPLPWRTHGRPPLVRFDCVPWQLPNGPIPITPETLGAVLGLLFGLSRQRWHADDGRDLLMRPIPSGGGCFPTEVTLWVRDTGGVYQYDVAHHGLVGAGTANESALLQALYATAPLPALVLLISVQFWKNAYKYGEFAYRLQSMDVGVVIGQALALLHHTGWRATVRYQFADDAVNALAALDGTSESVYAALLIDAPATLATLPVAPPLPPPAPVPGLGRWPLLHALHQAAMLAGPPAMPLARPRSPLPDGPRLPLPPLTPLDLLAGVRARHSTLCYFRRTSLPLAHLSRLLAAATQPATSDVGAAAGQAQIELYVVVTAVAGLPAGIYRYDAVAHALILVRAGDVAGLLQQALRGPDYNMHSISVCVLPTGCYEPGFDRYGDRYYRILNMEAGMVMQRLCLAAATLGLGSQPNLGFQVAPVDALLQLPAGRTTLAQIFIGTEAPSGQWYEQPI